MARSEDVRARPEGHGSGLLCFLASRKEVLCLRQRFQMYGRLHYGSVLQFPETRKSSVPSADLGPPFIMHNAAIFCGKEGQSPEGFTVFVRVLLLPFYWQKHLHFFGLHFITEQVFGFIFSFANQRLSVLGGFFCHPHLLKPFTFPIRYKFKKRHFPSSFDFHALLSHWQKYSSFRGHKKIRRALLDQPSHSAPRFPQWPANCPNPQAETQRLKFSTVVTLIISPLICLIPF